MWDRVRSGNIKSKYEINQEQDSKMSKLAQQQCSVGSEMRVGEVMLSQYRREATTNLTLTKNYDNLDKTDSEAAIKR